MTKICHGRCFNLNRLDLESECITSCYHKYLNSINKIRNFSIETGKKDKSEFISKIFRPNDDFVDDYVFPRTGSIFYMPNLSLKTSSSKIFPKTGYDPFKNPWELR